MFKKKNLKKRGGEASMRKRNLSDSEEDERGDIPGGEQTTEGGKSAARGFGNAFKNSSKKYKVPEFSSKGKESSGVGGSYEVIESVKSTRTLAPLVPADHGATVALDGYAEEKVIRERKKEEKHIEGKEGERVYEKKDSKFKRAMQGPVQAAANVRTTCVFDYQPDVCKDYKETGFCGFGDSCKFLHDRSDYKSGWQLDREWEEKQKALVKLRDSDGEEVDSGGEEEDTVGKDKDEVPFACFICRKPFATPIVTKCDHTFCEKCALKRFRKDPKCAVCGAQTGGVFLPAKKVIEKMKMMGTKV
eukprot:Nk52_evm5s106 gene=Nk52_evmTU5s106